MEALSEALAAVLRRQQEFDQRLARMEAALFGQPKFAPPPHAAPPPPPMPPPALQAIASDRLPPPLPATPPPLPAPLFVPSPPEDKPPIEANIGLKWVNRIGVITLVIGVGFFFKWAVDNQWIGPAGRVILGIVAGFVIIWAGDHLWRRKQQIFAQGVTGTGVCILYLAIYAAFGFYHLLPQAFAFVFMVAITAMTAALALRYDAIAIAALGMFGAYLTPILLSTGEDHPWFFFTYILIVDLGALALARAKRWTLLNGIGFAVTAVLYWAWMADKFRTGKEAVATVYLLLFYGLYASTLIPALAPVAQALAAIGVSEIWHAQPLPFFALTLAIAIGGLLLSELRTSTAMPVTTFGAAWVSFGLWNLNSTWLYARPVEDVFFGVTCIFALFLAWVVWWTVVQKRQARTSELAILALNGIAYFGSGYALLNDGYHAWMGLFAVVVAGAHLAVGYLVYQKARAADLNAVALALAFSLGYLTLAVPIQFTGYRITMAWAAEGAALAWIGLRLNQPRMRIGAMFVFALVALRLLTLDAEILPNPATYALLWNSRFLTFFLSALALWAAAWWTKQREIALTYYVGGHLVLLAALTMEDLGWAARNAPAENLASLETVSLSILWATYGVILVALGVVGRFALNRLLGLLLLGIVVLKLYVYDVWQVARVYRITAFVALGALLMATSYLYSRYRARIEKWLKNETPGS